MARPSSALLGLAALAALLALGAADSGAPGGVEFAWIPNQVCNDVPGTEPNCLKCDQYARLCLVCLPGFDFSAGGRCQWCGGGCLRCKRDAKNKFLGCTRCLGARDSEFPEGIPNRNPGYPMARDGNVCVKCSALATNAGCLRCDEAQTRCILCNDGYYLKNGRCEKCSGGPNCQTCNQSGVCTKCKQAQPFARGYGLNSNKFCVLCADPNCVDCANNSARCMKCRNGRAGTGERGWGVNSARGCSQCFDPLCASCTNNSTGRCWNCISNDYTLPTPTYPYLNLATPARCTKGKIANCLYYRRDGTCKECNDGYIRSGNRCDKLPACSDPDCWDCRGRTNSCNKCKSNFYFNGNYCVSCLPNCEACSNGSTCRRCIKGFGLVKGGTECTRCALQSGGLYDIPWCERCDEKPHRCTLCFPPDTFRPNWRGVCVPR